MTKTHAYLQPSHICLMFFMYTKNEHKKYPYVHIPDLLQLSLIITNMCRGSIEEVFMIIN